MDKEREDFEMLQAGSSEEEANGSRCFVGNANKKCEEEEVISRKRRHEENSETVNSEYIEQIIQSIWFDMKNPVELFTGREKELSDLHNKIQRNPEKPTIISQITSITGLGGIGKTELARKYAYDHRHDYDVIWINAENHGTFEESFLKLADRLGISREDRDDNEKTIDNIVEEIYYFFAQRKSLFIFDNAEKFRTHERKKESNKVGIDRFLSPPLQSNVHKLRFLITSRNQEWGNIDVIQLDTFTKKEAADFIRNALNIENKLQESDIENLVLKLQFFPLALTQVVEYIKEKNKELKIIGEIFDISDYLIDYDLKTKQLLEFKCSDDSTNSYDQTTFTVWKITLDKIRENKKYGKQAGEILDIIAYFAPHNIPVKLFLGSELSSDDREKICRAIQLTVKYSMINSEKNRTVLKVHRLVQQVIRIHLKDQNKVGEIVEKALELLKINFDYLSTKSEDYLKTLLKWMCDGCGDLDDPVRGKKLLEDISLIAVRHYGTDHLQIAETLKHIGNAYSKLGDFRKGNELLERAIKIQENHYVSGHSQTSEFSRRRVGSSIFFPLLFPVPKEGLKTLPIWFGMKNPVELFTGREKELCELHDKLHRISKIKISEMTCISGLGGIGKSELARKYAYDYQNDYDVIWINAENHGTLEESFLNLAADGRLGIPYIDGIEKTIETIIKDIYRFFTTRKSLFIFDNAEKYKTQETEDGSKDVGIDRFLPTSLPTNAVKPKFLITSRNQEWGNIDVIQLDTFTEKEAAEFIRNALNIEKEIQENDVKQLAETLQYFPLALQQAVAYIKEIDQALKNIGSKFDISDYLKKYYEHTKNFQFPDDSFNLYTKTTFTTWKITTDKIREHKYGRQAGEILDIIAYFAPNSIPIKILLGSERTGDDIEKFLNAVQLLKKYSIVSLGQNQTSLMDIHGLVQQVTRIYLKGQNKEEQIVGEVFNLLINFPYLSDISSDYTKKRQLLPHLEAFLSHIDDWIAEKPEVKQMIEKDYLETLLEWMSDGYCGLDNPRRKVLLERALKIKENYYGPDHVEVTSTLVNLSDVYGRLGHFQKETELLERPFSYSKSKPLHRATQKGDLKLGAHGELEETSTYQSYDPGYSKSKPLHRATQKGDLKPGAHGELEETSTYQSYGPGYSKSKPLHRVTQKEDLKPGAHGKLEETSTYQSYGPGYSKSKPLHRATQKGDLKPGECTIPNTLAHTSKK